MFQDRKHAAFQLAQALLDNNIKFDAVIGIPRGGTVLAEIIATRFISLMDIVITREIELPEIPPYGVGVVTPDGEVFVPGQFDRTQDMENTAKRLTKEINKKMRIYRGNRDPVSVVNKRVLLIDDGIATGLTMKAAVRYLKRCEAKQVQIAVPVCSRSAYNSLVDEVDYMLVLEKPDIFYAVGQFYENFIAVEDDDVIDLLKRKNPESPLI